MSKHDNKTEVIEVIKHAFCTQCEYLHGRSAKCITIESFTSSWSSKQSPYPAGPACTTCTAQGKNTGTDERSSNLNKRSRRTWLSNRCGFGQHLPSSYSTIFDCNHTFVQTITLPDSLGVSYSVQLFISSRTDVCGFNPIKAIHIFFLNITCLFSVHCYHKPSHLAYHSGLHSLLSVNFLHYESCWIMYYTESKPRNSAHLGVVLVLVGFTPHQLSTGHIAPKTHLKVYY